MESLPLLKLTKEDVDYSRTAYEIDDVTKIDDSIDAVLEWMRKEPHLAESSKYVTRGYLEGIFLFARGSTENTKKKIDQLFTMRALMPEICLHFTVGEFDRLLTAINYVPLPKLVPKESTRVIVTQFIGKLQDFSLLEFSRYSIMIKELRMHLDYNAGDRYIVDLNHFSIMSIMNPVLMKKLNTVGDVYGTKVKGVHLLNAPPYIDTIVTLIKSTMSEKVGSRIHVHNSNEDLHKHIDKDVLPEDFGGNEMSLAKLAEKWKDYLNTPESIKLIADQDKLVSDESKRTSSISNEDFMGLPGSFRKLNVD